MKLYNMFACIYLLTSPYNSVAEVNRLCSAPARVLVACIQDKDLPPLENKEKPSPDVKIVSKFYSKRWGRTTCGPCQSVLHFLTLRTAL